MPAWTVRCSRERPGSVAAPDATVVWRGLAGRGQAGNPLGARRRLPSARHSAVAPFALGGRRGGVNEQQRPLFRHGWGRVARLSGVHAAAAVARLLCKPRALQMPGHVVQSTPAMPPSRLSRGLAPCKKPTVGRVGRGSTGGPPPHVYFQALLLIRVCLRLSVGCGHAPAVSSDPEVLPCAFPSGAHEVLCWLPELDCSSVLIV